MDRVTGSRVKANLLLKGGEQGTPLKNEFRVTEPAPRTPKVKRGRLGEGGGEATKRCWKTLRQPVSGHLIRWRKEGEKERKRKKEKLV